MTLFLAALVLLTIYAAASRFTASHYGIHPGVRFGDVGSVDTFTPEIWSKKLLSSLKKAHIFVALCNTDYEGDINEQGDSVHINSIGRPTIATYTKGSTSIVPEQLTAAQRTLVVDQAKYFAFEVDDIDRRQNAGDLIPEALSEAAYGLRDVSDLYIEGLMRAGVQSANALGAVSVTTGDLAYSMLVDLKVLLGEANVPTEGRWVVIPEWVHGQLLESSKFIDASASADGGDALRNGRVGRAAGFDIHVSNNLPVVTGDDSSVVAGHKMATSYAEQINKVEAYRPEDSFGDAVKGLHLYGAKVVRPNCLATALASKT